MAQPQSIQHILPRHQEIMRRLTIGESQRDISHALGMTEGRMSIIVNSPLFQLELRKMQRRQEDRVALIQESLIANAGRAATRQHEFLEGYITVKDEGKDIQVPVGIRTIENASATSLNLFLRMQKGGPAELEDGEEPYEARLEREVTFKETVTKRKGKSLTPEQVALGKALDATHPPSKVMDEGVDDYLDTYTDEAVRATA